MMQKYKENASGIEEKAVMQRRGGKFFMKDMTFGLDCGIYTNGDEQDTPGGGESISKGLEIRKNRIL